MAGDNVAYIGWPIFGMYKRHGAKVYRDMTLSAARILLPDKDKLVISNAPSTAEITLNYQTEECRYVLHVLHYIPERRYKASDTIEDVIPLYNVEIDLAVSQEYDKAQLVPDRMPLETSRWNGRLRFVIPEVRGHAMVSIER